MWVILAFAIAPLIGVILAAIFYSGEDARRGDRRSRAVIFLGRVAVVLIALGCIGLLWLARSSLNEFHTAMFIIGCGIVLAARVVFHRASALIQWILAAAGIAMILGSMALERFDESGWIGLVRGAGWAALLIAVGAAGVFALHHFDKSRERKDAATRPLKDSTRS
ncbi:MAG: hypothetical protein ACT6RD_13830 [Brevundimonas sp.]|uniref:hypothetical protein n=1 Tax=Brevundimonas sp. TaxID=1871086 RepID=UPI004034EB75